jgi:hypothetical protein
MPIGNGHARKGLVLPDSQLIELKMIVVAESAKWVERYCLKKQIIASLQRDGWIK